jgi:hypothetical protein
MSNDIGFGTGNLKQHFRIFTLLANTLKASFPRVLEILNVNSFLLDWTDFWGRNDPDMLEVCI